MKTTNLEATNHVEFLEKSHSKTGGFSFQVTYKDEDHVLVRDEDVLLSYTGDEALGSIDLVSP